MAGFHGGRDGVELYCCRSNQSIGRVTRFFGRDFARLLGVSFCPSKKNLKEFVPGTVAEKSARPHSIDTIHLQSI